MQIKQNKQNKQNKPEITLIAEKNKKWFIFKE